MYSTLQERAFYYNKKNSLIKNSKTNCFPNIRFIKNNKTKPIKTTKIYLILMIHVLDCLILRIKHLGAAKK